MPAPEPEPPKDKGTVTVDATVVTEPEPEPTPAPTPTPEPEPEPAQETAATYSATPPAAPAPAPAPAPASSAPESVEQVLAAAGITYEQLVALAVDRGWWENPEKYPEVKWLPGEVAAWIVRNHRGIARAAKAAKPA